MGMEVWRGTMAIFSLTGLSSVVKPIELLNNVLFRSCIAFASYVFSWWRHPLSLQLTFTNDDSPIPDSHEKGKPIARSGRNALGLLGDCQATE
jgi:hypothetical protein